LTLTRKLSPLISGTRRAILECLLKSDTNAVTLAEKLRINISAVRGHLDVLEIAGLVSSSYEQAKRGRPKRIYTLTQLAYRLFPDQTSQIFAALVQAANQSFDVKTTNSLIRQVSAILWQYILPNKPSGTFHEQLNTVVMALDNFGFYASLDLNNNQYTIIIRNDVFRLGLSVIPKGQASQFQQEFWKQLTRKIERILVRAIESLEPVGRGYRVLIEERRE